MESKFNQENDENDIMSHGESFRDSDIVSVLAWFRNQRNGPYTEYPTRYKTYKLTFGILLRAYTGNRRVVKRSLIPSPSSSSSSVSSFSSSLDPLEDSDISRVNLVIRHFTRDEDIPILDQYYPPFILYDTTYELSRKQITLSPELLRDFYRHSLYPRDSITNQLIFHKEFLLKVFEFHEQVRRPEGTYSQEFDSTIVSLAHLPRDLCSICHSSRQLYCGDCGGIVLDIAKDLLNEPIDLPFDTLLIIHWQESMHKCTGMHARALCKERTVQFVHWPRLTRGGDLSTIIESLDPKRDVLLFPSDGAILASKFPWHGMDTNNNDNKDNHKESHSHTMDRKEDTEISRNTLTSIRHRLIVLEASWGHGKTMANQIIQYRIEHGLDPIPCVLLEDVIGQYWRFQREGHSAVSTIEAIAYTAQVAGLDPSSVQHLLILFQVQKYRVLHRVSKDNKPPQAIAVDGLGIGSWKEYTDPIKKEYEQLRISL